MSTLLLFALASATPAPDDRDDGAGRTGPAHAAIGPGMVAVCHRLLLSCMAALAVLAAATAAAPAGAFCYYGGRMNAKTTVAEEYRDARWAVRATILSADEHWRKDAGGDESWVVYRLRITARFKGPPARGLRLFSFHDSGGFYPDIGGDYLLFLDPPSQILPGGVRHVVQVNYACGQSRPWREIRLADRRRLAARARRAAR
jgi:hypothetical protein